VKTKDPTRARELIGPAITDVAGEPADPTQIERLLQRYHWTASYCGDRDVLEVACGTGQGLGLLRSRARRLFACDLSPENLGTVRRTYGRDIALVRADAQVLPFDDRSIDVVVLLEAIYFLPDADAFMSEARRVLRPGGVCLVSAINKDCPDFNPAHPLYYRLYGTVELSQLFVQHGFLPECLGIIPLDKPSLRRRAFQPLKAFAVKAHLIPDTMAARKYLKRIVFGKLEPMPANIDGIPRPASTPTPLSSPHSDRIHQVILCAGKLA
jgi:SAM-dependent methyltransferase